MSHRFVLLLISVALVFGMAVPTASGGEDALPLMKKVQGSMYAASEEMQVQMDLSGPGAPSGSRVFQMATTAPSGGEKKTLIRFESPSSIEGLTLLTVERKAGGSDNWLYLPALDQVRRVAATDRSESFVQSDFAIEDMTVAVDPESRSYSRVGAEPCGERACTQVEDRPKTAAAGKASGYGRVVLHVDDELSVVHRVDFYDKSGGLMKVLQASGLAEVAPGVWRFERAKLANLKRGTSTEMRVLSRSVGQKLDTAMFSPSNLDGW